MEWDSRWGEGRLGWGEWSGMPRTIVSMKLDI